MSWRDFAICRGLPTDVFYPEDGRISKELRTLCESCSVVTECLADAFRQSGTEDFGIRGGTTARERRRMRIKGVVITFPEVSRHDDVPRPDEDGYIPIPLRYDLDLDRFVRI